MNANQQLTTLDRITRRALRFFDLRDNSRRVYETILDYSFAIGQTEARLTSQRVLYLETGLAKNRVSEALADLVSMRLAQREGFGKGNLTLTPLPDWWNWAARPISAGYSDRTFLASLIGHYVVRLDHAWTIRVAEINPVVQYATAFARGAFDQPELFAADKTLNQAVAEVARAEACLVPPAGTIGPDFVPPGGTTPPSLSSINPSTSTSIIPSSTPGGIGERGKGGAVPADGTNPTFAERVAQERQHRDDMANAQPDDLVLMAAKLWPHWEAHRRDPFIRKLSQGHQRATYVALCRAGECQKPIRFPWGWLPATVKGIEAESRR